MNKSELTGIIKSKISTYLGCSSDSISEHSTLGQIGMDSLDCVDLTMHIEEVCDADLLSVTADESMILSDFIDSVYDVLSKK
jgi:acyl carrier protein